MSGVISSIANFLGYNEAAEDAVSIIVGNVQISGWTALSISRGIEIMPASAEFATTEIDPETHQAVSIASGDPCQVKIGDQVVLTGYVISVMRQADPSNHILRVSVASKSVDLVDCAAEFSTYQMNSTNVFAIVQRVCQPFGITVNQINQAGNVDIGAAGIILTETAYDITERLTRLSSCLFYDQEDGSIVLSPVGAGQAASGFSEGQNIESYSVLDSMAGRYSSITAIVPGPLPLFNSPDDDVFDQMKSITAVQQAATDDGVKRWRPLLIPVELGDDQNYDVTKARMLWEANRRWGRSQAIQLTCDSWRDSGGALWEPNTLAPVAIPSAKRNDILLIAEVTFRKDEEGTHADLVLMPKEAFIPEPLINPFTNTVFTAAENDGSIGSTPGQDVGAVQQEDLGPPS